MHVSLQLRTDHLVPNANTVRLRSTARRRIKHTGGGPERSSPGYWILARKALRTMVAFIRSSFEVRS